MENELRDKLHYLKWLLRRQRIREFAEAGPLADTTQGQGRILAFLKIKDGISTRDLSYLLGIQVPSLNELLAKMVQAGYVVREPADNDRRVMLVKLTDKGRQEEQVGADGFDIFDCLTKEEQATFSGLLDRVINALKDKVGDFDEDQYMKMRDARRRFLGHIEDRLDPENVRRMFGGPHRHRRRPRPAADCCCEHPEPPEADPKGKTCGCEEPPAPPQPGPEAPGPAGPEPERPNFGFDPKTSPAAEAQSDE